MNTLHVNLCLEQRLCPLTVCVKTARHAPCDGRVMAWSRPLVSLLLLLSM